MFIKIADRLNNLLLQNMQADAETGAFYFGVEKKLAEIGFTLNARIIEPDQGGKLRLVYKISLDNKNVTPVKISSIWILIIFDMDGNIESQAIIQRETDLIDEYMTGENFFPSSKQTGKSKYPKSTRNQQFVDTDMQEIFDFLEELKKYLIKNASDMANYVKSDIESLKLFYASEIFIF